MSGEVCCTPANGRVRRREAGSVDLVAVTTQSMMGLIGAVLGSVAARMISGWPAGAEARRVWLLRSATQRALADQPSDELKD